MNKGCALVYKKVNGKLKPLYTGLDHSQEEEYEMAKAENRQPRCVHCGEPLDRILQTQYDDLTWTWNAESMSYDKHDGGDAEKPYCGNCEAKDRGFLDEEVYTFF